MHQPLKLKNSEMSKFLGLALRAGAIEAQRNILHNDADKSDSKVDGMIVQPNISNNGNTKVARNAPSYYPYGFNDNSALSWINRSAFNQKNYANQINSSSKNKPEKKALDINNLVNEFGSSHWTAQVDNPESKISGSFGNSSSDEEGKSSDEDLNRVWSENDIHSADALSVLNIPENFEKAFQYWKTFEGYSKKSADNQDGHETAWQLDNPIDLLDNNNNNVNRIATTLPAEQATRLQNPFRASLHVTLLNI